MGSNSSSVTPFAFADRIPILQPNLHVIQAWQAVRFLRGPVRSMQRLLFGDPGDFVN
jgi:hypothetical protein